ASLVWFDESRLEDHKPYLLKHGAQTFNTRITRVLHRINIQTLEHEAVHTLGMNDIGVVEIATTRPIFFDSYDDNRATGSFILIDPGTNATAAAGMIRRSLGDDTASAEPKQPAALLLVPDAVQASEVEQLLLGKGFAVVRTRVASKRLWQALLRIGVIVLLEGLASETAHKLAEELPIEHLNPSNSPPEELLQQLREKGILPSQKGSRQ
ncbi:MAG: elongation factor 1-alpha C-terminal domain-related protein, partial [Edaphobacter sp.]